MPLKFSKSIISFLAVNRGPLLVFSFVLICFSYYNAGNGYNQNSRLALVHSMVFDQTFTIDNYHRATADKSSYNGHFYSDKAPGVAFLALPSFLVAQAVNYINDFPFSATNNDSPNAWRTTQWITTIGTAGIFGALGAMCFFLLLRKRLTEINAFIVTIFVFIGSLALPYSTMLFSHTVVIGLVCISLYLLEQKPLKNKGRPVRIPTTLLYAEGAFLLFVGSGFLLAIAKILPLNISNWLLHSIFLLLLVSQAFFLIYGILISSSSSIRHSLFYDVPAGLACGFIVISEYSALFCAIALAILALSNGMKRFAFFAVSASVPLALLAFYNWISFDNFFSTGYNHVVGWDEVKTGFFGFEITPNLDIASRLLASPGRGLFFWSPYLLMAFAGLYESFKERRLLTLVIVGTFLLQLWLSANYPYWHGGKSIGPRYLSPIIPFLGLACSYSFLKHKITSIVLGIISVILMVLGTAVNPLGPHNANPLFTFYFPKLLKGELEMSFGSHFLGINNYLSFLLYLFIIAAFLTISWWFYRKSKSQNAHRGAAFLHS